MSHKTTDKSHWRKYRTKPWAQQQNVGPRSTPVWFAYIGKEMLRDKRGVGRRFFSEDAAMKAAQKGKQAR